MSSTAVENTLKILTTDTQIRDTLERQEVVRTLDVFNQMLLADSAITDKVCDVADSMTIGPAQQEAVRWLRRDPQMAALMDERYLKPSPWSVEELLRYPDGSLGKVFGSELKARGFDPEFYRRIDVADDGTYVELRWRQTHDLWHVITGFETDGIGELGLQVVYLVQCHLPIVLAAHRERPDRDHAQLTGADGLPAARARSGRGARDRGEVPARPEVGRGARPLRGRLAARAARHGRHGGTGAALAPRAGCPWEPFALCRKRPDSPLVRCAGSRHAAQGG